jgi:hypothetical protein
MSRPSGSERAMSAAYWNALGLILSLVGILILFLFGMPFKMRIVGAIMYVASQKDESAKQTERIYDILGRVGLILLIIGTACQIGASF